MNNHVGVLKNCAMFNRITSYANIQLGSLTHERFHKHKALSSNTHAKLSLVRRDKVSSRGLLSPVGLPLENKGKVPVPVYTNFLYPLLFWLWGLS